MRAFRLIARQQRATFTSSSISYGSQVSQTLGTQGMAYSEFTLQHHAGHQSQFCILENLDKINHLNHLAGCFGQLDYLRACHILVSSWNSVLCKCLCSIGFESQSKMRWPVGTTNLTIDGHSIKAVWTVSRLVLKLSTIKNSKSFSILSQGLPGPEPTALL